MELEHTDPVDIIWTCEQVVQVLLLQEHQLGVFLQHVACAPVTSINGIDSIAEFKTSSTLNINDKSIGFDYLIAGGEVEKHMELAVELVDIDHLSVEKNYFSPGSNTITVGGGGAGDL